MLPLQSQFILRQAVKSSAYLINPPVLESSTLELPRLSVVHYLDTKSDRHFPDRNSSYFNGVEKDKKLPIQHIADLDYKEDVTTVENKYAPAEIRKWNRSNIKGFKETDLLSVGNSKTNVVSMVNYNILKDLYKYKTSLLSAHNEYSNLYKTYWGGVKKALSANNESIHFVTLELPNSVPSYNILEKLTKFTLEKFSRVITDPNLKNIIEIFRWLDSKGRSTSILKSITDEEAKRIYVEFTFRGHSTVVPLATLRSVNNDSDLDSTIKLNNLKALKLYIIFLRKVQDRTSSLIDDQTPIELDADVDEDYAPGDSEEAKDEFKDEINDETDSESAAVTVHRQLSKFNAPKSALNLTRMKETEDTPKLNALKDDKLLEDLAFKHKDEENVESLIKELDIDTDDMDEFYEQSILSVDTEAPEASFTVDYNNSDEKAMLMQNVTLDDKYESFIETAKEFSTSTPSELKSLQKVRQKRTTLSSPYNKEVNFDTYNIASNVGKEITPESMELVMNNPLVEDIYKEDVLRNFDDSYLKNQYRKDIVSSVGNLENSGIIIKDYEIEEVNTSTDNYEVHRLSIKPLNGKDSTILFRLPKIDREGKMRSGNITTKLRKVRTDLPIRKIAPTRVALSSNYGKFFVFRSERSTYNPYRYYVEYIKSSYLDDDGIVTKVVPRKKTLNKVKLPNVYSVLASEFNEVKTKKLTLLLDYEKRDTFVDEVTHKTIESKGLVFAGHLANKHILVVDKNEIFYDFTENLTSLGKLENLLEMNVDKIPKPFSMIKILGDNISLGVVLAYYLGLSNLMSVTDTKHQVIGPRERYTPEKDELVLRFDDHKLVLLLDTVEKKLLFNGFLFYTNYTKQHELIRFNHKDIYLGMIELRNSNIVHLKETDLLRELFLDPITVDVLKDMNEPQEFIPLLLRANELLTTLDHPDINDPSYSRIRGYDRVAGLMYRAMVESVREHRMRGKKNSKIELDPYRVWNYILSDNTTKITEEVNPIVDLKEKEVVTFTGRDGLSSQAIPMALRSYHEEDIGLISESTVDSKDVAVSSYLAPHAKLKNTRGMVNNTTEKYLEEKATAFSTSALLAPMSENDDAKRINFISIQNGHNIAAKGYKQASLRTGYEYVMPFRVSPLYASMAKEDGQVVSLSDSRLVVKYKSGKEEVVSIGTQYGKMEGLTYPHELVTELLPNKKFKKGDPLAWNEAFFEKDWLQPDKIIMKSAKTISVALTANDETYEDSCSISSTLSDELSTSFVKERVFIIESNKNILNLLAVGDSITPDSIFFTVLEEGTDYSNLSDTSVELLQNLATLSPRAKIYGELVKYEIKYNGEVSDMSPTFRKLATKLDKQLQEETAGTEYPAKNNRVSAEYRSSGKNLNVDTLELKVMVKVRLGMSSGDKAVFANQMKSVVSDVFTSNIKTETNKRVEAYFSYKGILSRVVNSPILIGTTTRLIKGASDMVADIYFGK